MKKFFQSLSGVFAALPGVAILISSLGVPDPGYKILFGGIIEALGCGILGLVYFNRNYFLHQNIARVSKWVVLSFTAFFIFMIFYIIIYQVCVKNYEDYSQVYFPLFTSDQLSNEINSLGGKLQFVQKWGGDGVKMRIERFSGRELIITNVIFLVLYQFIFSFVTLAFALLGIREEKLEASQG
jgi:hypothetical protein